MIRSERTTRSVNRAAGSVFILTLGVLLVLTSLALVMARSMRVEAAGSANDAAALKADAVARGAMEYVRSIINNTNGQLPTDDQVLSEAVPVGDGYFWLLKPDADSTSTNPTWNFGLIDEAGKLNLNIANPGLTNQNIVDMLVMLPGVSAEMAASIMNWRLPETQAISGGATSEYYLMLPRPYHPKNSSFETIEELLLVKDVTPSVLYGQDTNRNGVLDASESGTTSSTPTTGFGGAAGLGSPTITSGSGNLSQPQDSRDSGIDRGLYPYVTVYSRQPRAPTGVRGLINIMTAPRQVLMCLTTSRFGLTAADVDTIISHRDQLQPNSINVRTLTSVLGITRQKAIAIRLFVTTSSYTCSADVVAVDGSGRGFKRYWAVFDARSSPPKIVYWRDLTPLGWPLDPGILATLRSGQKLASTTPSSPTPLEGAPR